MTVLLPSSIDQAVAALADYPGAQLLAGGTDFMVEVNAGHRRPDVVVGLGSIPALRQWEQRDGWVTLGAGVTYTDLLGPELARLLPALAQAARTVGSPSIRNAGTIGGNLGTASPAGDTLPVLAALDAVVEVRGPTGDRDVPIGDFVTGPKRTSLEAGEMVTAVRLPVLRGHQEYRKVGVRNAMVIAIASLALAVDQDWRTVRCALGSVGPVPLRARTAESWLAERVDWERLPERPAGRPEEPPPVADPDDLEQFGRLVAEVAQPIDDHRSTASYRRHAIGVLAQRAATAAFGSGASR